MKITTIIVSTLMTATMAFADGEQATPECKSGAAAPTTEVSLFDSSRFSFKETLGFYNYDSTSTDAVSMTQSLVYKYSDNTSIHLDIPFFSVGNTGFGMTEIGFDHTFIKNPCKFIDSVSLGIDFDLPTGEDAFGGDDVNIAFGFDVGGSTTVEKLGWDGNFRWVANRDLAFQPILGGLTSEDIINAGIGIKYEVASNWSAGFGYDYWEAGDSNYLSSIGPSISWKIANNIDFNCEFNFTVDQGAKNDTDTTAQFGLAIKF